MKAELDSADKTDPAPASPVKDSRPVGAPADHPTADDSALVTPPDGTWVDTVARQYARILQAFGPPNPAPTRPISRMHVRCSKRLPPRIPSSKCSRVSCFSRKRTFSF